MKLFKKPSGWTETTQFMIYCCVTFAAGDLLFGIDTGSFGSLQALPSWLRRFGVYQNGKYVLPTKRKSIMNSVPWIGKITGTIIFEPILERIGFKNTAYLCAAIQCVALVLEMATHNWIVFSIGRVIAYLAVGIIENVIVGYQAEVSPAPLRGFWTGSFQVLVTLGNLWGGGMSRADATETTDKGWRVPVGVQFIPALIIFVMVPFTVESPRWLILHGHKERAIKNLDRLRPAQAVEAGYTIAEVNAIEQAIQESMLIGSGSWADLFRGTYLRRSIIVAVIFFLQETSGNQYFNSYGPTFYQSIGLGASTFTYTTLGQAGGTVCAIITVLTVDKIGRRPLLIFGATLAALFCYLSAGLGSKSNPSKAETNMVIASLILLNSSLRLSVTSLCFVITAEIGGVRMRKKMMAWATAVDVLAAFIVTFCTPYIQGTPGAHLGAKVGYIFGGCATICVFFCAFCVPELKGRSLEEVDELFERHLWAWQFKDADTTGVGALITQLEEGRGDGKARAVETEEVIAGKEQPSHREVA